MFDETDFKHTQWTLDCCVADESLTFIQEIQENFFEPLIGKKQNKKPNKHYFSHYYRVTRTYRGGSVLMLRSGGRFKGSHFKHKALVNIKITAKKQKNSYTSNNSVAFAFVSRVVHTGPKGNNMWLNTTAELQVADDMDFELSTSWNRPLLCYKTRQIYSQQRDRFHFITRVHHQ